MHTDPSRIVHRETLRALKSSARPVLLGVSGGLDSMTLLHAMVAVARDRLVAVATFDHGTGPAARAAVRLVCEVAAGLGVPVVTGQARNLGRPANGHEASWRDARRRFLKASAERIGATVMTAHTEDDQLETVLMRILRGSGARGLAGLYAPCEVVRPLLRVRREVLEDYARAEDVRWVDDPSNESSAFLRNRVRHDLLPALRGASPGFDTWLLDVAHRAAAHRVSVERFVTDHVQPTILSVRVPTRSVPEGERRLFVASSALTGYDRDSLAMLWSAIAGRAGLALDRRGTERLSAFTTSRPRAGSMPLAGGWCLEATHTEYILQKTPARTAPPVALPVTGTLDWGGFRFRARSVAEPETLWSATIASSGTGECGVVRAWQAGDRLAPTNGQPRRRVTRYLSDVKLTGAERRGWPVVVAGEDVVWIPGVRRSDAATERPGRPVRHYVCERIDR